MIMQKDMVSPLKKKRNIVIKVQEGLVISQEPKPGTELKEGDTVKVIISKGVEPIPRRKKLSSR